MLTTVYSDVHFPADILERMPTEDTQITVFGLECHRPAGNGHAFLTSCTRSLT